MQPKPYRDQKIMITSPPSLDMLSSFNLSPETWDPAPHLPGRLSRSSMPWQNAVFELTENDQITSRILESSISINLACKSVCIFISM